MTKMRVRDLSNELNISNRELIQLLREKNIQVKSHMSGLTDTEVEMVRDAYSENQKQGSTAPKKVQSGVIVRKRKKKEEEMQTKPAPKGTGSQKKTEEELRQPEVKQQNKDDQPRLSPQPKEKPSDSNKVDEAKGDKKISEQPEEGQERKKRKRNRRKKQPPQPQVKVISRPDPLPEPEQPKPQPQAVKPAQAKTPHPKPVNKPADADENAKPKAKDKPGKGKAPMRPEPNKDEVGKRKKVKGGGARKKDKRVVEAAELYHDDTQVEVPDLWTEKITEAEVKRPKKQSPKRGKGKKKYQKEQPKQVTQPLKAAKRKVRMEENIRVVDLAQEMGIKAQDIIKTLFGMGVMATINQSIDVETATLIAAEFDYEVESKGFVEEDYLLTTEPDNPEQLRPRPPVVTIMGHVDHGKTSLLDAIRKSSVTSGEAGGITQHIGAYHVPTERGEVVFLDTPGHEAFTAMRARGAQVTDLVILVVAADDGVMEQTREAVSHSKAAGVPIVVAVNKIDKEGANPDKPKRELAELGLVPEEWGGDTIYANVSAKQRIGLDELLEMVLLQAEVLELQANPEKRARGHIVEARLDKGRGPVATVLVQEGTLNQGDAFVCGIYSGKLRALFNDQGKKIKKAGPAIPVEVLGMEGVPEAGEEFVVVADEKVARKIAETRLTKRREKALASRNKVTLETFLAAKADEEVKNLNLVLKADVQGSQEAIAESLNKLSTPEVKINIIHSGTGAISESDILLAAASNAILIGFNIRPTAKIKEVAEHEDVEIRFYDIIYKLVGDIKDAMSGMLAPIIREQYLGQATVLETFNVPKVGTVAGCLVNDGKLKRNAGIRLLRDGVVVYTGKLSSLKRFKDDVKEVTKGFECGTGLENFNDVKKGDIIDAFEEVEEQASLS